MHRLHARLCIDYGQVADATIGVLPHWVQTTVFADAVAQCDPAIHPMATARAMALVRAQRRLRELIDAETEGQQTDEEEEEADAFSETDLGPEPAQPMVEPVMDPHRVAAIVRLCHGELLEAYATRRSLQLCRANEVALSPGTQAEFALLCSDAGLVATWTSAHAEYLATINELLIGTPGDRVPTVTELFVPPPELHSVPCAANNADLIALYERAASPKACPKGSQGLLAVLTRVTNAGSRGWESTLESIAKESDGSVRVCMHALGVALSGLHPCIHPAARRRWHVRSVVVRRWRACNPSNDFRELVRQCPVAVKEVMRLHLATLLTEDAATLEALAFNNMPAGQLSLPPRTTAPTCLQAAMHALAGAGEALAASPDTNLFDAINVHLTSEPRSRKKTVPRPTFKLLTTAAPGSSSSRATAPLSYCCSWLGGRSGLSAAALCSATTVVANLLAASFRADYVPFWLHSHRHGLRASRLDAAQYRALHEGNAAHSMCALLDERTALRVQRLAMTVNRASLLTVAEALALLNGTPPTVAARRPATAAGADSDVRIWDYDDDNDDDDGGDAAGPTVATSSASSRVVQEAEQTVLALGGREAAMLMLFARCCALRSQMLAFDLGAATRAAQARAVCKRLLIEPNEGETHEEAALQRLPAHCTSIFACSECKRVANARQDGSGKEVAFNELGLAASMLRIDAGVCDGHMRCAKRSSAALRTAVALEEAAKAAEVECRPVDEAAALPKDLRPASVMNALHGRASDQPGKLDGREAASDVAKLRRDIKNCYEQHPEAVACGDVPLVRIPVLGRAVRVFDEWHALCAFCGCLARIHPTSRFRGDPCCMRCDFAMLHGKEAAQAARALLPRPPAPSCRYCGKTQPEGASARWKTIAAPADTGGRNAAVPPPLRVVCYCPLHWRSWLTNAHKEIPTNIIFAHILQKARPMFGADRSTGRNSNGRHARLVASDVDCGEASGSPTSVGTVATVVAGRAATTGGKRRVGSKSAIARRLSSQTTAKRQRKHASLPASGGVTAPRVNATLVPL